MINLNQKSTWFQGIFRSILYKEKTIKELSKTQSEEKEEGEESSFSISSRGEYVLVPFNNSDTEGNRGNDSLGDLRVL